MKTSELRKIIKEEISKIIKLKGLITEDEVPQDSSSAHDKIKQSLIKQHPRLGDGISSMGHGLLNHKWGEYKMMMNFNNGAIAAVDDKGHYTCWRPTSIRGSGDSLDKVEVYGMIVNALQDAGFKTNPNIGVSCGQNY